MNLSFSCTIKACFLNIKDTIIVLGIGNYLSSDPMMKMILKNRSIGIKSILMEKRMRKKLIVFEWFIFSIFLAIGCTSKGETYYVRIQNSQYYPRSITISPGDTVRWTNLDSTNHTVVGANFSSGNITSQDSYEHTFTKKGNYSYYCSIDPSMKGVVIVK